MVLSLGLVLLLALDPPFMNSPQTLAHLPTKDLIKTPITSNSVHEVKMDAFNPCNVGNGELPKTLCPFIFPVNFHKYR